MLGAVVGKDPAHLLHPGTQEQVSHEQGNADHALTQVNQKHVFNPVAQEGAYDHGQQEEQADGEAQGHRHGNVDHHLLGLFVGEPFGQPLIQLGGLFFLRFLHIHGQVRRAHQRLDARHHGTAEANEAPDQGPGLPGAFFRDLAGRGFGNDALGGTHHQGVQLRAPHHDALDQRLPADHGLKLFPAAAGVFFCHLYVFPFYWFLDPFMLLPQAGRW